MKKKKIETEPKRKENKEKYIEVPCPLWRNSFYLLPTTSFINRDSPCTRSSIIMRNREFPLRIAR